MRKKFTLQQFFYILATLTLVIFILAAGRAFLIPLLLAIVLTYLLISLQALFDYLLRRFNPPRFVSFTLGIITCVVILFMIWSIISVNIDSLGQKTPAYQNKLILITESLLQKYRPESAGQAGAFLRENIFGTINISQFAGDLARTFGSLLGQMGLVIVYTVFMLIEHKNFYKKLRRLVRNKTEYSRLQSVFSNITKDLNTYFKIKAVASVVTGLLSYILMLAFGLDFAAFWALLVFLLNFVPTVGSLIATTFPILMALVQFDGGILFIIFSFLLISIQILIGTFLEPRYQGSVLNISPLVIVLSLIFWASMWGPVGALLSIPIMATLNIVCSKFESTQWVSALMSADGKGKGNFKSKLKLKWKPKIKL